MRRGEVRPDRLWWFPTLAQFWLESGDARADYEVIKAHPDAIFVTNPEQVSWTAMTNLRQDAKRRFVAAQTEARDE